MDCGIFFKFNCFPYCDYLNSDPVKLKCEVSSIEPIKQDMHFI